MDAATLIGVAGTVGAAVIGLLSAWLVRRANRHVDASMVRRNTAEAVAIEVKTARELLVDVKSRLVEQQAEHAEEVSELRERHDGELKSARDRLTELDAQVRRLSEQYAAHKAWDDTAMALLRTDNPHFPEPPPIGGNP